MSQVQILSIGKTTAEYLPLISHWLKMIKLDLSERVLIAPKGLREEQLKVLEAKMLKQHITRPGIFIAMDACGIHMASEKFAQMIGKNIDSATPMTFVIGGAYGIDKTLLGEADLRLSLSQMTMPHLLAKLVLVEQIYRAETIMRGHPYHK